MVNCLDGNCVGYNLVFFDYFDFLVAGLSH